MRRITVLVAALAVVASGCVTPEPRLNSERIASKYGNYGVEIIAYEDGVRYSNLYSMHDGARVCRTFAVVRFDSAATRRVTAEHEQVLAGGSIGATFKASGWRVSKQTLYVGALESASEDLGLDALMHIGADRPLAMHVYRLWIKKAAHIIEYATIIEVHHPDYIDYPQLQRLFHVDTDAAPTSADLRDWRTLLAAASE